MHLERRLRARSTAIAFLLCASSLLAACGSSSSTSAAHKPSPTPSHLLTTQAFSIDVPGGWRNETANKDETSKFAQNGMVLVLLESPPPGQAQPNVNDITANINIVVAGSPVPDDQLGYYLTSVNQNGATNVSQPQPFMVDGHAGLYITYERDVSGTPGQSQDMVVNFKGETYDIFLNTSKFAFPKQLPALEHVLDSWRWRS